MTDQILTDDTFLAAFEARTLPAEMWTHRAHVRVAYLYLHRYGLDEAIVRMRNGIKAYNVVLGIPDGPLTGYNETTTQAFVRIIHAVMVASASCFPAATSDAFCDLHPQLMSKHILRFFYSPAQRLRPEAKTQFVEPDMAPLPVPPPS